jgi:hypothetical protein
MPAAAGRGWLCVLKGKHTWRQLLQCIRCLKERQEVQAGGLLGLSWAWQVLQHNLLLSATPAPPPPPLLLLLVLLLPLDQVQQSTEHFWADCYLACCQQWVPLRLLSGASLLLLQHSCHCCCGQLDQQVGGQAQLFVLDRLPCCHTGYCHQGWWRSTQAVQCNHTLQGLTE